MGGFFVFWITFRCIFIFYNKDNYLLNTYSKYEIGKFFFRKISYYAKGVKHFPNMEFIWTIIPALILIMIGIPSFSLLYFVEQFAEPIVVLEVDTRLILPTTMHIQVITTSVDVLHCWSVPAFGMKLDCCPGRLNETMLYIKRPGIFYGQCSEICGMNHAFMPIVVNCVKPLDFVILAEFGVS